MIFDEHYYSFVIYIIVVQILIDDPEASLDAVLIALNDPHTIRREEMRRLFEAWTDCGKNIRKLLAGLPELKEYLFDKSGKPMLWAVPIVRESGPLQVMVSCNPSAGLASTRREIVESEVRQMFILHFLKNELQDEILGPCDWKNCKRYFRQRGERRTKFCSRICCQRASATKSRSDKLKKEREDKLKRAVAAARKWQTARTREDWKSFVCGSEPDITPKFLTRAVTEGELTAPIRKER